MVAEWVSGAFPASSQRTLWKAKWSLQNPWAHPHRYLAFHPQLSSWHSTRGHWFLWLSQWTVQKPTAGSHGQTR